MKDIFLHISATKVVASWTLFVGIFIMVLDVFFQDSNVPKRQKLKKHQGQDIGVKGSPIPVSPLLFVHDTKHMEQFMKEAST